MVPELIDVMQPEDKDAEFNVCMVMEYIQSDLNVLLKNKIDFNERQLLKIIYNSLLGISFVHFTNVVHRDIKPGNLLLTASCEIKVCDFGLARSIAQAPEPNLQPSNTLKVRAKHSSKNDIADVLSKDKDRRHTLKRNLSLHVGSRWYRAPEISILEKQYDQASDMWSFGCIIYELLQYIIHNEQNKMFIKNHF